jgi:hypothetical protein
MKSKAMLFVAMVSLLVTAMVSTTGFAQSPTVTDDNLSQSIASAKTPPDHEAIAAYYDKEAAASKEKADLHRRAAASYRKMNMDKPVGMANMCDNTATMWDKVATDTGKLADAHHEMAKTAAAPTGQ